MRVQPTGHREKLMSYRMMGWAAALATLAAAWPAAAAMFEAETFTLPNGLQVVVLPNHRAPIATQMVWYKAGADDEQRGKTGIAHFLEHLMFRGTKETPPGAFSRIVAENGGSENAFTTNDYTAFFQNVAADRLPLVMKLEADRMTGLVIDDAVVNPERKVIIEERHMRIDNQPAALLNEQLDAALYLNQREHAPTIGWESEMRGLGTKDAQAFYRTWYAPNNAVLVLAGDVTVERAKKLAETYFGPVVGHPVPPHLILVEPPKVAATRLVMKSSRVAETSWTREYLAPSYVLGETHYAYALQVLAEVLGGGANSRLYKSLVVDQGVALNAGAAYDPELRGLASFDVYATPKHDVALPDFEAKLEAILKEVLAGGLTEDEIDRAKKRMQTSAIYAQDGLGGPARIVGAALAIGRTLDDVQSWPDRIGAVTLADVTAAARLVIHDDVAVTGVLEPQPTS
jgi:zinc protease